MSFPHFKILDWNIFKLDIIELSFLSQMLILLSLDSFLYHLQVVLKYSLAASLANSSPPLQQREKLYLLAVGYYRTGEYAKSRQILEQCLEVCFCSDINFFPFGGSGAHAHLVFIKFYFLPA